MNQRPPAIAPLLQLKDLRSEFSSVQEWAIKGCNDDDDDANLAASFNAVIFEDENATSMTSNMTNTSSNFDAFDNLTNTETEMLEQAARERQLEDMDDDNDDNVKES